MQTRLTITTARDLEFDALVDVCEEILAAYDPPDEQENALMWKARVDRTIDQMPAVYRWFLTLQARFDHYTDEAARQVGTSNALYKNQRQRRDLFKNMASAAKRRYEAASRSITMEVGFDPTHMPSTRAKG